MIVGVLVPDIRNPFFAGIVSGLETVFQERGYLPVLCSYPDEPRGVRPFIQYVELMVSVPLAGAIVLPVYDRHPAMRLFRANDIPVVSIDNSIDDRLRRCADQQSRSGARGRRAPDRQRLSPDLD